MSTLANRNAYLRSFPVLASMLGHKYGIRVEIGGNRAATDGKTIYLPALPLDMPEELFILGNGYLDHEAAHILATDFETLRAASLSPFAHWLLNIVEDMRVERHISKLYPGCKTNLEKIYTHLCRTQKQNTPEDIEDSILGWFLYSTWSRIYPLIPFPLDACQEAIEQEFPNLLSHLDTYLDLAEIFCTSTATSLEWACEVEKFLIAYLNQSVPEQSPGKDSGKGAPTAIKVVSSGKEGKNSQQKESAPADMSSTRDALLRLKENIHQNAASQTGINQLKELLNSKKDLPLPVGEAIKALMEEVSTTYSFHEKVEVAQVQKRQDVKELPSYEIEKASKTMRTLSVRLSGLLQTQTLNRVAMGRRGKVDCSRLYRLQAGNSKIFRRDAEKQNINTAIHILLDSSDSMWDRISLACAACYSVAAALSAISGLNVGVTNFYGGYCVTPILRHGERMHRKFLVEAWGGTPMDGALWWVYQEVALLKEKRKIILVLSDGVPNSISRTEYALQAGQKLGVEVYGIGIGGDAVDMPKLIPGSQLINSIDDLAPTMLSILQEAMIKGSAAAPEH